MAKKKVVTVGTVAKEELIEAAEYAAVEVEPKYAAAPVAKAAPVKEAKKEESPYDMVKIQIPSGIYLKIKKQVLAPGIHMVPRHQLATITEMVDKKQRADLSVFVGKKYMVDRLADRSIVVREEKD